MTMPEQNEDRCSRCGELNTWDGRTHENICASCRADEAQAYAAYQQERDWLDSQEQDGPRAA